MEKHPQLNDYTVHDTGINLESNRRFDSTPVYLEDYGLPTLKGLEFQETLKDTTRLFLKLNSYLIKSQRGDHAITRIEGVLADSRGEKQQIVYRPEISLEDSREARIDIGDDTYVLRTNEHQIVFANESGFSKNTFDRINIYPVTNDKTTQEEAIPIVQATDSHTNNEVPHRNEINSEYRNLIELIHVFLSEVTHPLTESIIEAQESKSLTPPTLREKASNFVRHKIRLR